MLQAINEEFYSLQGEGLHTGIPMYFVRLQGCTVGCYFCDTKYTWKNKSPDIKAEDIIARAKQHKANWICLTGGEPHEQDFSELVQKAHEANMHIQIETSGQYWNQANQDALDENDWTTLSPKDLFSIKKTITEARFLQICNEIKCVVTKQEDLDYYIDNYYSNMPSKKTLILNMVDNKTELLDAAIARIEGLKGVRIMHQCHKVMNLR